jgi:arabinofuranan 3-O-arabinosyltransferase
MPRRQPANSHPRFFDLLFDALFRYFGAATPREKLVLVLAIAVVLGYAELLLIMEFKYHAWILDGRGRPLVRDFAAFWTAGHEALSGRAHAAYNPALQHAAEVALIGRPYSGMLGWSYPPIFLFAAAALAVLPYAASFVVWCLVTALFQAGVVASIAGRRSAFVLALAAPWALIDIWIGQNGLLTAALVGLVLLYLEHKPLTSGLLLGALSYKPQFGVLFPLALAAAGYWRAFGWAALGVVAMNGLAGLVFGFDTFSGFFGIIGFTGQTHLNGGVEWRKLQSIYALARALGSAGPLATAAQICCSVGAGAAVAWSWHTKIAYTRKAALLGAALPLVTPYVFVYDLPVLAIALAFLYRERPFDRVELALLAATAPLLFLYSAVPFPTALGANLAVVAMVGRRFYGELYLLSRR